MNKPSTDKRIGASVGRYTIHNIIGTGGMANVYAATDDTGGWCAVKILHRALATDEVAVARFFEEAYLVNRVKHPGVCRIVDDGVTADRCPFLVMDLLNGETLESRIEGEVKLPVVEVLDIGIDVAEKVGHDPVLLDAARTLRSPRSTRRASFIGTSSPRTSF